MQNEPNQIQSKSDKKWSYNFDFHDVSGKAQTNRKLSQFNWTRCDIIFSISCRSSRIWRLKWINIFFLFIRTQILPNLVHLFFFLHRDQRYSVVAEWQKFTNLSFSLLMSTQLMSAFRAFHYKMKWVLAVKTI